MRARRASHACGFAQRRARPVHLAHQDDEEEDEEESALKNEYGTDLETLRESTKNQLELATVILDDEENKYFAISLYTLASVIRDAYLDVLEQHSYGPQSTAKWFATRAGGGWQFACKQLAEATFDGDVLDQIHCKPGLVLGGAEAQITWGRAEDFLAIAVNMISHRAWQQIEHSTCPPSLLQTMLHENPDVRTRGVRAARRLWEAVLEATAFLNSGIMGCKKVEPLLKSLYFTRCPYVKEMMLRLQRANSPRFANSHRPVHWRGLRGGPPGGHARLATRVHIARSFAGLRSHRVPDMW